MIINSINTINFASKPKTKAQKCERGLKRAVDEAMAMGCGQDMLSIMNQFLINKKFGLDSKMEKLNAKLLTPREIEDISARMVNETGKHFKNMLEIKKFCYENQKDKGTINIEGEEYQIEPSYAFPDYAGLKINNDNVGLVFEDFCGYGFKLTVQDPKLLSYKYSLVAKYDQKCTLKEIAITDKQNDTLTTFTYNYRGDLKEIRKECKVPYSNSTLYAQH